jgi:hypothetical protein
MRERIIRNWRGSFKTIRTCQSSTSPYPRWLQERIVGPGGHISNFGAAALLNIAKGMRWACLAHLSEDNNTPALALRTHQGIVDKRLPIHVATRNEATDVMEV